MVSLRSSKRPCSPFTLKKFSCKSGIANSKVPCTNLLLLLGCFSGFLVCGAFLSLFLEIWGFEGFLCLVEFCLFLSSILQPEELWCRFRDIQLLHWEWPSRKWGFYDGLTWINTSIFRCPANTRKIKECHFIPWQVTILRNRPDHLCCRVCLAVGEWAYERKSLKKGPFTIPSLNPIDGNRNKTFRIFQLLLLKSSIYIPKACTSPETD